MLIVICNKHLRNLFCKILNEVKQVEKKCKKDILQQVLEQLIPGISVIMLVTTFFIKYSFAWMYIPLLLLIVYAVLEFKRSKFSIAISIIYCLGLFAIISIFVNFENDYSKFHRIIAWGAMGGGVNTINSVRIINELIKKHKMK
ncbi:hypothetical protein [Helicovermis profundi]|uniref:Uncharacterized protein n=1 Tax=Helicovermis profundi TaxID=3065157 RepID=A0AAU9EF04_9FIRM|nr:hypothetical protein HLPR_16430 [Clostridia bacterium S502]